MHVKAAQDKTAKIFHVQVAINFISSMLYGEITNFALRTFKVNPSFVQLVHPHVAWQGRARIEDLTEILNECTILGLGGISSAAITLETK